MTRDIFSLHTLPEPADRTATCISDPSTSSSNHHGLTRGPARPGQSQCLYGRLDSRSASIPRLAFRNTGVLVGRGCCPLRSGKYRVAVVVKRVISQLILPPLLSYQIGYYVLIGRAGTCRRLTGEVRGELDRHLLFHLPLRDLTSISIGRRFAPSRKPSLVCCWGGSRRLFHPSGSDSDS